MRKKLSLNTSKSSFRYSTRSRDLPATQGMLHLVRNELKSDSRSLRSEMNSRFNEVDARFNQIDARFNQVDARFKEVDARFNRVDSKLEKVLSEVSRLAFIVEEQNSRNQIVLEGLSSLFHRQDRVERRMGEVENLIHDLAARPRR